MKKLLSALLCFCVALVSVFVAKADESAGAPKVSAEAFVLYCADNGQVICAENEHKKMKPASTTKLMTTLIALEESAALNRQVTFKQDMIAEGSSMYLKVGDRLTLSDLAAGMMMASGNDAANAAALTISGSTQKFANRMNERARQIGMKNTHFVTPSGLDDEEHYSTAYDMALLMAYALENDDFAKLTSQKNTTVNFINPASKKTTYSNHNRLLSLYKYCIGGKTGYTMAAGRCLVSAAKKDGLTLVCVTLNDRNDWNDHISLYDYGFEQYAYYQPQDEQFCIDVPCVGGKSDKVDVMGERSQGFVVKAEDKSKIERRVCVDSFLYAPIFQNEVVGKVNYMLGKKTVFSTNLLAVNAVDLIKENKNIFDKIKEFFTYD